MIYMRNITITTAKSATYLENVGSLARQLNDCRRLCDQHGWARSPEREITDEGRSAYHGANRADGSQLASFENDAVAGLLPQDTVLVVERLDRISRQSAVTVFQLVSRLTECGVAIATVDGDRIYRRGSFDFASLIELIVKAQVAHEESEKKSQRGTAAWSHKRVRAQSGDKTPLTRRCPAWIEVDEKSKMYRLREDRAVIVRRIFSLASSGHGKHLIARQLNLEGVPAWRGANGWHASYIQKILVSRATVGEMQPHRKVEGKRVPEGDPICGFYPPVIDELVFAQVQADRASRTTLRGRRGRGISNLFSGLAKCVACGGGMTFRNKGKAGEQYLVCDNALRGRGCGIAVHFNYPVLEAAIIDQTLHFALSERHLAPSKDVSQLERLVSQGREQLAELEARRRRLVELYSRFGDEEVVLQLDQVASEIVCAKDKIEEVRRDLTLARGAISPLENVRRIRRLLSSLHGDDAVDATSARGTVQQAMRSLIRSIVCDPNELRVTVDTGSSIFTLDRGGRLLTGDKLGLASLLAARERGWVVTRLRDHPALGISRKSAVSPSVGE